MVEPFDKLGDRPNAKVLSCDRRSSRRVMGYRAADIAAIHLPAVTVCNIDRDESGSGRIRIHVLQWLIRVAAVQLCVWAQDKKQTSKQASLSARHAMHARACGLIVLT